ncbi:hypothetical protein Bca52824_034823 [Brassica carinata]|uniref:Uncharacterized protein n=1 Tax=Brassica carinata TaxID=52824 RepID=A0A8X7V260_BRACI|nr:hypothetical protein Bca52824_034823 [Brassica carinata]
MNMRAVRPFRQYAESFKKMVHMSSSSSGVGGRLAFRRSIIATSTSSLLVAWGLKSVR